MAAFPSVDDIVARRTADVLRTTGVIERPQRPPPILPTALCQMFDHELDWHRVSGFDAPQLQDILINASTHVPHGRAGTFSPSDCVFLAIVFMRSGMKMSKLSNFTPFKTDKLTRAIHRGLIGLSARMTSADPVIHAPRLSELISSTEAIGLHPDALNSRFIVDGRHMPCTKISAQEDPTQYFSYKLNHTAIQFQVVVTHTGECVNVSNWARAATHDLEVYRATRSSLLQKLQVITGGDQVKILADEGYRSQVFGELVTSNPSHESFNRYRLVVENFFGRMCAVFLIGHQRISIGQDLYDPLIKSLCYLTTIHIRASPLRPDEHINYYAHDMSLSRRISVRRATRANSSRAYRARMSEDAAPSTIGSESFHTTSTSSSTRDATVHTLDDDDDDDG